jgi:putative flavoprotein involved in K+ transport
VRTTTTVIVGAGHAGLAMSRCLTERSIDHVLLERGEVANSWRTGRWESLRLLTPNWQSRLPGFRYEGHDPDGFMTMPEVTGHLANYAEVIAAPVETNTTVTCLRAGLDRYHVTTTQGEWRCRTVVLAGGACTIPDVPDIADAIPRSVTSCTPAAYRNPEQLPDGGVLIAGASATGVQLADEIHRSGRPVTLAVGSHVRAPRLYRGKDIMWWLDAAGILDERFDQVDDIVRARRLPSFQLIGSPNRATIDLNSLRSAGVRVVGRLAGINNGIAQFSGSLSNQCTLADLKLSRLLDTIDEWVTGHGLDEETAPPQRFAPTHLEQRPPLALDLTHGEITTVIWATGYRPDHSWLDVPVLDGDGQIHHNGGVTAAPGLYVIGMPFLRRRKSSLIDGAGDDARDLSAHLAAHLAATTDHKPVQAAT